MPFFTFRIDIYRIMVMKKKYVSLMLLVPLLTGCNNSIKLEYSPYSPFVAESYMGSETTPVSTLFGDVNSLSDLLTYSKGDKPRENIIPTGDRKILVVPILFTDSEAKDLEAKTIFLQNAFFGKKEKTNYESVASYYNKSSLDMSAFLLEKVLVATMPSAPFGIDGYLRISYCAGKENIMEGIKRIKWALDKNATGELKIGNKIIKKEW